MTYRCMDCGREFDEPERCEEYRGECRRVPTDVDLDTELDELIERKQELLEARKEYDEIDKRIKEKVGGRQKIITGQYLIERKSFVKKAFTVPEGVQYRISIKQL